MIIYVSDDDKRLSEDTLQIMQQAAELALNSEFEKTIAERDAKASDLPLELSVTVVGYEEIRELNRDYRGIDRVTDVLSFPQFADEEELADELTEFAMNDETVMLGDVVICYDRALEQAEEYDTGIKRELVYLFVHSIFHLLGYDHESEDEKSEMRAREEFVMDGIGIPKRVD